VRRRARERLWHHAWLRGRIDESRAVLNSLSERTDSFQGRRADLRRLRLATRTCHYYAQQDPARIPGEPQEIPDIVAEAVLRTRHIRSKLLGGTPSYEMVAESGHARCLLAVGRTREARRHVDRADSLASREDIPLLRTYVRLNVLEGRVLEAEGRLQAAIDHYRDHLNVHATRQEALLRRRLPARLYLARAYHKVGKLDRAADTYEAALRKRPAHPYLNRSYARLLAEQEETAAASRHLRRALEAWSPADPAFRPKRRLKNLQDGLRAGVPSPGPLPLASGLRGGAEPRGDAREDVAWRSDAR
jgi:tetratricopeptide (TPR) repeat protein